ncbi:hypothetical protein HMI54_003241 [Coelomomyces lativittatus]|nr:hypothetical protein HMI55_000609 [Coelomomyces lativittatus]KAJ1508416.1 hypothetical protein HMI54_003241 [Coelomomyces lativittatus]KAJ1512002.1 hypothetical protein HMI56_004657 [Coelomomyces lativittatus]
MSSLHAFLVYHLKGFCIKNNGFFNSSFFLFNGTRKWTSYTLFRLSWLREISKQKKKSSNGSSSSSHFIALAFFPYPLLFTISSRDFSTLLEPEDKKKSFFLKTMTSSTCSQKSKRNSSSSPLDSVLLLPSPEQSAADFDWLSPTLSSSFYSTAELLPSDHRCCSSPLDLAFPSSLASSSSSSSTSTPSTLTPASFLSSSLTRNVQSLYHLLHSCLYASRFNCYTVSSSSSSWSHGHPKGGATAPLNLDHAFRLADYVWETYLYSREHRIRLSSETRELLMSIFFWLHTTAQNTCSRYQEAPMYLFRLNQVLLHYPAEDFQTLLRNSSTFSNVAFPSSSSSSSSVSSWVLKKPLSFASLSKTIWDTSSLTSDLASSVPTPTFMDSTLKFTYYSKYPLLSLASTDTLLFQVSPSVVAHYLVEQYLQLNQPHLLLPLASQGKLTLHHCFHMAPYWIRGTPSECLDVLLNYCDPTCMSIDEQSHWIYLYLKGLLKTHRLKEAAQFLFHDLLGLPSMEKEETSTRTVPSFSMHAVHSGHVLTFLKVCSEKDPHMAMQYYQACHQVLPAKVLAKVTLTFQRWYTMFQYVESMPLTNMTLPSQEHPRYVTSLLYLHHYPKLMTWLQHVKTPLSSHLAESITQHLAMKHPPLSPITWALLLYVLSKSPLTMSMTFDVVQVLQQHGPSPWTFTIQQALVKALHSGSVVPSSFVSGHQKLRFLGAVAWVVRNPAKVVARFLIDESKRTGKGGGS